MTNPLDTAPEALLNSVKFASIQQFPSELIGQYSRDRLHFELSEQPFGFSSMMAGRFWTRILEGKAYNETYTVATQEPATWWQHLKMALLTAFPASILGRLLGKVRYTEHKSSIRFEGHWSYPQADWLTPHVGPVHISEQASLTGPHYEVRTEDRFLHMSEIVNEFYRREIPATAVGRMYKFRNEAEELLVWLEHHKVNVNQLVPRNSL